MEDWSVDPDDWGTCLCTVFDEWYRKDLGRIYVNFFDAMVEIWMDRVSLLCTHGHLCGKSLAMEHDGSVYSCDHYVYPEYRLGSISGLKRFYTHIEPHIQDIVRRLGYTPVYGKKVSF